VRTRPGLALVGGLAGLVLLLVLLPLVATSFQITIATTVYLFIVLGHAWNIIGGYGNRLSLGHAAFFAVGAYTSTIILIRWDVPPPIGILAAMAVSCVLAVAVGFATLRLEGAYFAIATLAIVVLVELLILQFDGLTEGARGLVVPFRGHDPLYLQFGTSTPFYYIFLVAAVLTVWLMHRFEGSRLGYRLRAAGQDENAARSVGIDTPRVRLRALMISAAVTAAAGTLYAQYVYVLDPVYLASVDLSVLIAVVPVVGGVSTVWGPVVAAAVLVPIEQYFRALLPSTYAGAQLMLYGVILIFVLRYRPDGLWGMVTSARHRFTQGRAQNDGAGVAEGTDTATSHTA
jgi:branched-chain amino acid transport system permease protein